MPRIETNIQRVKKSVADEQGRYKLRSRNLAKKTALAARDNVRSFISKPTFPGYAMTGALARKVVASEPTQTQNGWQATVRIQLTGRQKLYAMIHEFGGRIKAKNAPYLVIKIPGVGWRKVKQVTIRAKRYFAKGIEKTRREWSIGRQRGEF